MNQNLTVNKEYWQDRNPGIKFYRVKKAYFGEYLIKVKLDVVGASMRYHRFTTDAERYSIPKSDWISNTPTYTQFLTFLKAHVVRFNVQKLMHIDENRYVVVKRDHTLDIYGRSYPSSRIYDARVLHNIHNLLLKKPAGVRLSREADKFHIYGNDIEQIQGIIDDLEVKDHAIFSITSPNEDDVAILRAGKEFNSKAGEFQFKVWIKPMGREGGLPELHKYLNAIRDTDEVEVTRHFWEAIAGASNKHSTSWYSRSYMYVKSEATILFIKMLAGEKYSNCVELILPNAGVDK